MSVTIDDRLSEIIRDNPEDESTIKEFILAVYNKSYIHPDRLLALNSKFTTWLLIYVEPRRLGNLFDVLLREKQFDKVMFVLDEMCAKKAFSIYFYYLGQLVSRYLDVIKFHVFGSFEMGNYPDTSKEFLFIKTIIVKTRDMGFFPLAFSKEAGEEIEKNPQAVFYHEAKRILDNFKVEGLEIKANRNNNTLLPLSIVKPFKENKYFSFYDRYDSAYVMDNILVGKDLSKVKLEDLIYYDGLDRSDLLLWENYTVKGKMVRCFIQTWRLTQEPELLKKMDSKFMFEMIKHARVNPNVDIFLSSLLLSDKLIINYDVWSKIENLPSLVKQSIEHKQKQK